MSLVKQSTSLLPMDDIANEMSIKYCFSKKVDNSIDTDKVAGVNSGTIAIAATDPVTGDLINGRETVKNALNLNGVPAADYVTKEDAAKIEAFGDNVSKVYADEMANLKDELYQIKEQLVRQGLLKDIVLYSGYEDTFKDKNIKYIAGAICGIKSDAMGPGIDTVFPEAPTEFDIGDFIVIHKNNDALNGFNESNTVVRIVDMNTSTGSITFAPAVTDLTRDNVTLYKSLGEYNKGTFSFSKIVKNVVTNKEKYTMLNDDNAKAVYYSIKEKGGGFKTSLYIPNAVQGALSKFTIKARSFGAPGSLKCYVIPSSEYVLSKTIAQERELGNILAESQLVSISQIASDGTIDFNFQNPDNGSYSIFNGGKYCFVIEARDADSFNYWDIGFAVTDNVLDIKTNNETKDLITGQVKDHDLYFVLATRDMAEEVENPYKDGLYTSKFSLPKPIEASRARLMLRIAREGMYHVSSSTGAYKDTNLMNIWFDENSSYKMAYGTGIKENENVAIGTNIRQFSDINSTQLTLKKGVYVEKDDPVYRIGFSVYLKAKLVAWDEVNYKYVESNKQTIELPLTAIIPDYKDADKSSDRLIFESLLKRDEKDLPLYVNTFELQIKWNSNFSVETIASCSDLIGRINNLVMSFDKTL